MVVCVCIVGIGVWEGRAREGGRESKGGRGREELGRSKEGEKGREREEFGRSKGGSELRRCKEGREGEGGR